MLEMQGAYQVPGIDVLKTTTESHCWWGRFELQVFIPTILASGTLDSGNTPTDLLRPGLVLARTTATNKVTQWGPGNSDGSEIAIGFLAYDQKMQAFGVAKDRWFGYCLAKGLVKAGKILIPGNASYGIAGDQYEMLLRSQLTAGGKFVFDDDMRANPNGGWMRQVSKTGNYAVLASDNNTLFDITGAGGGVTFTLPAPRRGLHFGFYASAAQALTVASASAGQLIYYNNAAGSTIAFSTGGKIIGGMIEVIGQSTTLWETIVHLADPAQTVSYT